ncbi:major facilitator superfamily domain-containing protein 8-like [Ptychodera flava]|uniref:major facilitator superfamily domain-containing protein 8-like n=1 Tax=Ptychodera flava TaxID=63121 RepID=UPI00396A6B29
MDSNSRTNNCSETTPLLKDTQTPSEISTESPEDYRRRWWSIRIMYFTMFIASLGFSIVVTSIWPYLKTVENVTDTTFLGWLVAAYSLGQLVASPLFGLCSNHVTAKWPVVVSLIMSLCANTLYAYVGAFHSHNGMIMLAARVGVGISAGNVAVARSFVSGATTLKERTPAMTNLSASQSLGFILGPVVQTAFSPVGEKGVTWDAIKLTLNMYTIPAFVSALLALINLIIVLVLFKEYRISDTADADDPESKKDDDEAGSIDKVAVVFSNVIFFVVLFVFSLNETIGVPLSMDMFAWTRQQAVYYTGFILAGGSIIALASFMLLKPLSRRFDERIILTVGIFFMLVGFVFDIPMPWAKDYPPRPALELNATIGGFAPIIPGNITKERVGCDWTVDWCDFTHKIYLPQYLVGAVFLAAGYPAATVMSFAIYSKILGPKPQGVYMGLLTGTGSLARTLGPIFVSQLYAKFGPKWTFLGVSVILMLTIVTILLIYRRLIPYIERQKQLKTATSIN